jgi:predicted nucleotidyltransferase
MNSTGPDDHAARAATDFARALIPVWQTALGPDLLGCYLIGSLAHGGFSRRYSDIDMAVVTEAGLSPQIIEQVRVRAAELSAEWGPKVSLFWADRQFSIGRFPPLDRIDYLDRLVVLMEHERVRPIRPTLGEIRAYLSGTPFANWVSRARGFAAASALEAKNDKGYLRALLYPARFCYAYMAGAMGSNDDAVAFMREGAPPGLDLSSIEQALQCRRAAADPGALFGLRGVLPAQVDACAVFMSAQAAV